VGSALGAVEREASLLGRERVPDLARDGTREQASAHPDAPVDAPPVERQARLGERQLPREDVRIHAVDEGSVEVEDERAHGAVLRATRRCAHEFHRLLRQS